MGHEARWKQIADELGADIVKRRYKVGVKLGSLHELADEYRCGVTTIQRSLATLEYLGVVESRQGSGYYVTAARPRNVLQDWKAQIRT